MLFLNVRIFFIILFLSTGCGKGALKFSSPSAVATNKIPALADNFNDNQTDTSKWELISGGAVFSETNQRLEIALPTAPSGTAFGYGDVSGYFSKNSYNMIDGSVYFELVQADTSGTQGDTEFWLTKSKLDMDNLFSLYAYNGDLAFNEVVNGVWGNLAFTVPYDPVQHRFFKISHQSASNILTIESSPDNVTWITLGSITPVLSMDNMYVGLTGIFWGADPTPGTVIYDNFVLYER